MILYSMERPKITLLVKFVCPHSNGADSRRGEVSHDIDVISRCSTLFYKEVRKIKFDCSKY